MSYLKNGMSNGHVNGDGNVNGYDQFINDQIDEDSRLQGQIDQSDYINNTQQQANVTTQKITSILDGLTEDRAERAQILLKNLSNEDLVHILPEKIPAFLRIDKDIQNKKQLLFDFYQQYQNFNIEYLDKDVRNRLVQQIEAISAEYYEHGRQVDNLLAQGEQTNQNSLALQNETVRMRVQQNQNISEAMKESNAQLRNVESQNGQKQDLRDRLYQMQSKLRQMQVTIETESIKNNNLKNVRNIEIDLRKARDDKESELLSVAVSTQKESMKWTMAAHAEIQIQDDEIRKESNTLKTKMSDRQNNNVQQLLKMIESDMQNNKGLINDLNTQIQELDGNYLSFKSSNKQMQSQMQKMQDTFKEFQDQERDLQNMFDENMATMEDKIREQNELAQQNISDLALTQKQLKKLNNQAETLSSKIEISGAISQFYDSCNYKEKCKQLQNDILISKQKGSKLEQEIQEQNDKWADMYERTTDDLRNRIEQTNSQRSLMEIQSLVENIKEKEDQISSMQQEIQQIMNDQQQPIDDEELLQLKDTMHQKVTTYKLLMNDKAALFEEMHSKALIMINRDQQIIQNQEEMMQLKHEIDINILEIEQKTAIINELQDVLQERKAQYKALKQDIKELEEQCEELNTILKQKEQEYDTLEDVLRDKDVVIEGLEKTLGEKAPIITRDGRGRMLPDRYKALKGDLVDEMLAKYINSMEISVPIRRLGDGFYLFGTRRIYAKVMNSKLVVRVGGGYMSFSEFIDTYALAELKKINELQATGEWDLETFVQGQINQGSPEKNKQMPKANGGSRQGLPSPMRVQGRQSPNASGYMQNGRKSPTYKQ